MSKSEFMELQRHWYKKLADEGFRDVEIMHGEDFVLDNSSQCYLYRSLCDYNTRFKEEYFRCMYQMASADSTVFSSEVDRYILVRHSEGARKTDIVEELYRIGTPRCRRSIRVIIRRYEMAWGIKYYNRKQLNLKKTA